MGGKWTFQFKYGNRQTLDLQKYQTFLSTIRDEFTSKFADMNPNEGEAKWTTPETENANSGNASGAGADPLIYKNNIFAQFSYKCTRTHGNQGMLHGTWILYWNPKLKKTLHKLHARCAPELFKELSNQIQEKLAKEFPQHFSVDWENGISGYEPEAGSTFQSAFDSAIHAAAAMSLLETLADNDNDDTDSDDDDQEFCPHDYPWDVCPGECAIRLVDKYYSYYN